MSKFQYAFEKAKDEQGPKYLGGAFLEPPDVAVPGVPHHTASVTAATENITIAFGYEMMFTPMKDMSVNDILFCSRFWNNSVRLL